MTSLRIFTRFFGDVTPAFERLSVLKAKRLDAEFDLDALRHESRTLWLGMEWRNDGAEEEEATK